MHSACDRFPANRSGFRQRPGIACTARAMLAAIVAAPFALLGVAHAQTPEERCLLDALRRSPAATTAGDIRAQCGDGESAATVPPADTSDAEPETGPLLKVPNEVAAPSASESPVRRRIDEEAQVWNERFALLPHRPNYIAPLSHAFDAPDSAGGPEDALQRNEVKFQLSFKLPLTPPLYQGRAALFFAYTGQSWWQAYNEDRSSPFREYSHEPELFVSWTPRARVLGWDWRLASAGFVHQSNGRSGEHSRSWNRLFADLRFDRPGGWWIGVRPWWRIPEDDKPFPGASRGDDNPHIERFVGDGELRLGHVGDVHQWTLMMRRSFAGSGKGAVQIDYSRPTGFSPRLRWHLQYFDGYAESLLDYRTRIRRLGFGVMLNDWY